ncbi:expressed unknown protein [Seminavis robusta]|uniref:Uncharacterized protein n=1 Tax=Seminavis robusta TaxID=568900 RepID=A0A9N8D9Q2_9STRA|nr:expressed unknown protein [Seminavis robusta]|eukprot:Sro50_g028970.1 n/a (206) ;mRNA; f:41127-41744
MNHTFPSHHHPGETPSSNGVHGHASTDASRGISRKRSTSSDSQADQAWHCFKRLRLQTSDESSYHSCTSGEDSVYGNNSNNNNNIHHWRNGLPTEIGPPPQHRQHPGQPTSSEGTFGQTSNNGTTNGDGYSHLNILLGSLHQQRRQRIQPEANTATTQWPGTTNTPSMNTMGYHHQQQSYPLTAEPQRKLPRRQSVRLPCDSKLL